MAFFWMFWILAALFVVQCVAKHISMVMKVVKAEQDLKEAKQKLEKAKQETFEWQCWRARLRRETEPTGVVHYEYNGHCYVAISHSTAEVPALYLSMRRMMMEVENGPKITVDGKDLPVGEWNETVRGSMKGKHIEVEGYYMGD